MLQKNSKGKLSAGVIFEQRLKSKEEDDCAINIGNENICSTGDSKRNTLKAGTPQEKTELWLKKDRKFFVSSNTEV